MKTTLVTITFLCLIAMTTQAQTFFKDTNGKYGLKNSNGKVIIKGKYTTAGKFENNLAVVEGETPVGNKFGVIDATGKEVTQLQYSEIKLGKFGSSKYEILIKALDFNAVFWTLIDPKTGENITNPRRYYAIEPFINGRAFVEIANNSVGVGTIKGYIDETGKEINTSEYSPKSELKVSLNDDEQLISIYIQTQLVLKIDGGKFIKAWKSMAEKYMNRLTTKEDEGFLRVEYDKYNNRLIDIKNKADKIPINEKNMNLKSAISKLCEAEQSVIITMYVMLRETDRKYLEDNAKQFEKEFKKRDDYSANLVTQYKKFINELP